MTQFLKAYGKTEGPLGLPATDKQATMLDQLLKALPAEDRQLVRLTTTKAPAELLDGERADVSWITTEAVDLDKEIVLTRGMNDASFAMNPLVTMQHCYHSPPVGKSLWRKKAKDGAMMGVKAKTQYPAKPEDWPAGEEWSPDCAFALVKAGMLQGKSIGFIRLKSHAPTSHEIAARPELADVRRIVDEWMLLEYALTFLPTNPSALVQAVAKSGVKLPGDWHKLLGLPDQPASDPPANEPPPALPPIPFTTWEEVQKSVQAAAAKFDLIALTKKLTQDAYDRARGRV